MIKKIAVRPKVGKLQFGTSMILANSGKLYGNSKYIKGDSLLIAVGKVSGGSTTSIEKLVHTDKTFSIVAAGLDRKIITGEISYNFDTVNRYFYSFDVTKELLKDVNRADMIDLFTLYGNTETITETIDKKNKRKYNNFETFFSNLISKTRNPSNKITNEVLLSIYHEYIPLIYMNGNYDYYYNNMELLFYVFNSINGPSKVRIFPLIPSVIYGGKYDSTSYEDKENIDKEVYRAFRSIGRSDDEIEEFLSFINEYTKNENDSPFSIKDADGKYIDSVDSSIFLRVNEELSYCDMHIDFFSFLYNYTRGLYSQEQTLISRQVSIYDPDNLTVSRSIRSILKNERFNPFLLKLSDTVDSSTKLDAIDAKFIKHSETFKELMDALNARTIH